MSFTFQVDDVEPSEPRSSLKREYRSVSGKFLSVAQTKIEKKKESWERQENKFETKPVYEAHSHQTSDDVFYQAFAHGFAAAAIKAYDLHLPLCIDVEAAKLTIIQQFGIHVNENSEALRNRIVNHEGKKEILVRRDDFVKGGNNPWHEVFGQFGDTVKSLVKDPELVAQIQHANSTTTPITQAAMDIALLDVFQKYFEYTMQTLCGIPSITILGTVDDWIALKSLVEYLARFDFEWYTSKLLPILDEFILAARETSNVEFWKNMVRTQDHGSGSPKYYGWMKYFFAYKSECGKYVKYEHDDSSYIQTQDLSGGISSVPFTWKYYDREIRMKFLSGFFALGINARGEIYPEIGWIIQDLDDEIATIDIPINFAACVKYGERREHAVGRYKGDGGIRCDMCRGVFKQEPCISYMANSDLCIPCYDRIRRIMALQEANPQQRAVTCDMCHKTMDKSERITCDTHIKLTVMEEYTSQKVEVKNLCSTCHTAIDIIRNSFTEHAAYVSATFERM